jgi:hypothetical protein
MEKHKEETNYYRALVAIETDATRYYGATATRPGILDTGDAEQMLAHLAADLKSLMPDVSDCSLIAAGALYDQTQILRPGYPVFGALEGVATSDGAGQFKPGLVSIGATEGIMPVSELQPLDNIPLGLLQLLPVVIHGPSEMVAALGQAMEYRFMEEGQLSAHSAAWLETAFGISINHARLMTLTDLNAMLRMQLEHFGFLPMWELLDAALTGRRGPIEVNTASGKNYQWKENAVHTTFETFDYWANEGAGAKQAAARQILAGGYGDWTREVRQYLTTLKAHGLETRFSLAGDGRILDGTFFCEDSDAVAHKGDAALTEHSFEELGTIAVTALDGAIIKNYYPLRASGLNDIHYYLRNTVPGGQTVAFPGTIHYNPRTRKLRPDSAGLSARQ